MNSLSDVLFKKLDGKMGTLEEFPCEIAAEKKKIQPCGQILTWSKQILLSSYKSLYLMA